MRAGRDLRARTYYRTNADRKGDSGDEAVLREYTKIEQFRDYLVKESVWIFGGSCAVIPIRV